MNNIKELTAHPAGGLTLSRSLTQQDLYVTENAGPAVVGQLHPVVLQPLHPEHVGVRLAASSIVKREEDAAQEEVSSWLQLSDGGGGSDAEEGQVGVCHTLLVLLAHVGAGVRHDQPLEDEGAVGCEARTVEFV